MILISSLIGGAYSFLIGSFIYGFQKKNALTNHQNTAKNYFSIVIAFRNEANNLPELLHSLQQLKYPTAAFEIILVDDHSEDASKKIIEKFSTKNPQLKIQLISNVEQGKKPAISLGVQHANFDWILTTDADCELPEFWINSFDSLLQEREYKLIAGPVVFKGTTSFLHQFQDIDFLSLQGSTIGSFGIKKPFMCNAANCGFHKETFLQLKGYDGNKNIASGDDVFLLEKMLGKFPTKIGFLTSRDAIVATKPQNSWKQLLHQRMRWAAKSTAYKNPFGIMVGIVVLSSNILLGVLIFINLKHALYFFIGKAILDAVLIQKTAHFFSKKMTIASYLATSIGYPLFNMMVFMASLFFKFTWKGRLLKK